MMIAGIDGLCGSGIHYASGKKTGRHSDPTYQAFQSLSERRENLVTAKEKAAILLDTATTELKRIPDRQMQELLYLRHFKNYKWHEISDHFGAGHSADMLKQRHSRFRRGLKPELTATKGGVSMAHNQKVTYNCGCCDYFRCVKTVEECGSGTLCKTHINRNIRDATVCVNPESQCYGEQRCNHDEPCTCHKDWFWRLDFGGDVNAARAEQARLVNKYRRELLGLDDPYDGNGGAGGAPYSR